MLQMTARTHIRISSFRALMGLALVAFLFAGCQREVLDNSTLVEVEGVSFSAEVQPIFANSCGGSGCHLGNDQTSGVNLSTYERIINSIGEGYNGPIVIAGDGANSPIIDKLGSRPRLGSRMPDGGAALSSTQISLIRTWIDEGALDN